MDENKLKKLKAISYTIFGTCGLCKSGDFGTTGNCRNLWGTCKLHTYNHKKHSESSRQLSISIFGSCNNFEIDVLMNPLEKFNEFLKT